MKYCAKCGNSMEDDMMFCQKCGTKFEAVLGTSINSINEKIDKMKKYNLVLDSQSITWEYLREDGDRAGNITVKQDKLCVELAELVNDILSSVTEDEKDFVEREVYTYVLQMGYKMCKEGQKLFSNYTGYKELFDMGHNLVASGQLNAETFLNQMLEQDYVYKAIAGLQGLHSSRIKEALDENVIRNNLEFINLTKKLAEAFNEMWYSCVKRYTDFYLSPGEPYIENNWELYNTILKGLPISEIDSLNESGWDLVLNDWEKNHNGGQYKRNFLSKRDSEREVLRAKEKELEDKKYWEAHPEEYKLSQECQEKIKDIQSDISAIDKELQALKNEKAPLDNKRANVASSISEKNQRIEKLQKKIFGKKKAAEEIQVLSSEIATLQTELEKVALDIQTAEKPILEKQSKRNELQKEIQGLQAKISELRSK